MVQVGFRTKNYNPNGTIAAISVSLIEEKQESKMSVFEPLVQFERFGSYTKLLKTCVLVIRFIAKLKRVTNVVSENNFSSHNITVEEYSIAEYFLVKNVQECCFFNEIDTIKQGCRQKNGIMKQLKLILNDDLLRCQGRIGYSDLDYESRHPLLLPKKHNLTRLLILDCHDEVKHGGINDTIAYFRQRWWAPQICQNVKSVLRSCIICKRYQGRPYRIPESDHLPPERSRMAQPFEIVGIDFTGSLTARMGGNLVKCYVALFTCAVSRAVHLELVENLTADSFLNSFRRFIGRRSTPRYVYSDNATNFTSASRTIDEILKHPKVIEFSSIRRCEWRFIPKRAPWFGGFWERMIGMTKTSIKKTLGRSLVTFEELQTLLVEIEARLNCRPLTYSSGDINDSVPLTPSHLIFGRRLDHLPLVHFRNYDENFGERSYITARHRKLMNLISHIFFAMEQRIFGFFKRISLG